MRVGGASAAEPKRRRATDVEMAVLHKICRLIATLPPEARLRVLSYVSARAETLPPPAEDGAGTKAELPPLLQHIASQRLADAPAEN